MPFPILPGSIPAGEVIFEGPTSYTPALTSATGTNPNLGSTGEAVGVWFRMGLLVWGAARFLISGTGASPGTGRLNISLPLPVDLSFMGAAVTGEAAQRIGGGRARSATAADSRLVTIQPETATTVHMSQNGSNSSIAGGDTAWSRFAVYFEYVVEPGV